MLGEGQGREKLHPLALTLVEPFNCPPDPLAVLGFAPAISLIEDRGHHIGN